MNEKVEYFFRLLHPEYDTLSEEEQLNLRTDKRFIRINLDVIENYYQRYGDRVQFEEMNEQERVQEAVKHVKVDNYFALLHPEYDTLSEEEKLRLKADKRFIIKNFNKIDYMYARGIESEVEPALAIKQIVNIIRVKKFRDILYAKEWEVEQEDDFSAEKKSAYYERQGEIEEKINFIKEHIDEIEQYYQDMQEDEGMTEQKKVQISIDKVREKMRTSEEVILVDESKFEQIYGKARGKIKEVFSKIKSFFHANSKESDKTKDETIK